MRAHASLTLVMVLSLALAACAGVLGIRRTSPEHPFPHRAHVSRGIACKQCHVGIASAGDEGPLHLPTRESCMACHQKPHDARECSACHGEAYVRQGAVLARQHLRFSHEQHLKATHGECVRCHVQIGEASGGEPRALRPTMATCFGCHEHADQWRARDCDGCHVDMQNEGTLPEDHLVHDGDWIREHGLKAASARDLCASCHSERSCAKCHGVGAVPALPSRLAFDQVKLEGLHRAGFRSRHAEEARAEPGLCMTCHSQDSCQECHARLHVGGGTGVGAAGIAGNAGNGGIAGANPHPPGWVTARGGDHGRQARIDPMSCAACHGGAGEQLCVGCHRVGGPGGNPHGPGFTSTKNKLRDVPCRECHAPGAFGGGAP